MSTNFAVSINNIATSVAVAYTPPSSYPTVIGVVDASGISLSGSQWIRLSTFRSGSPLSILHAESPVSANGVAAVTLGAGGSGYSSNPTVTFTPTNGGSGATATATVVGGVVTAVTVTASGSGYIGVPTVSISGGSGATPTAVTSPYCLKITGTADSYTDVALLVGDAAELRVTAGAFNDLATAVNTLESGVSPSMTYDVANPGHITIHNSSSTQVKIQAGSSDHNYDAVHQLNIYDSSGTLTAYMRNDGAVFGTNVGTSDNATAAITLDNGYNGGSGTYASQPGIDLNKTSVITWSNGHLWYGGDTDTGPPNVWLSALANSIIQINGYTTTFGGLKVGQLSVAGSSSNGAVTIDANGYLTILTGSTAPGGTPATGGLYLDTTAFKLYARCGSTWKSVTLS